MKKILLLFVATFFVLSCSKDSTDSSNNSIPLSETLKSSSETEASRLKITGGSITVSIGRKSRDCDGFGICVIKQVSVTVDDNYTLTYNNQNRASVKCNYETTDTKNFYLNFDETIINDLIDLQGSSNFIFEEDFVIDSQSATTMGLVQNFTIAQGTYPIVYNSETKLYEVLLTDSRP